MRMKRLLVPVVGGLLATVVTAGAAGATGTHPEPPDEPPEGVVEALDAVVECLRIKGVDVPEGDHRFRRRFDLDDKKLRAAVEACREEMGDLLEDRRFVLPVVPPERLEELREGLEEFHACLREEGVDVPELPETFVAPREHGIPGEPGDHDEVIFEHAPPGEPEFHTRVHPLPDLDEADHEAFQEAVEACGGSLPPRWNE